MTSNITISPDKIAAFCKRHHIRRLSLFGSVLGDSFRQDSDIDVLVEFQPGYVPGFITLSSMQIELSDILEKQADLRTPASLSEYFRNEVETMAELIYEQD